MQSIDNAQAERLLLQHWRLQGKLTPLASYADRNFKISTAHGNFVLKIANPNWSWGDLDLENAALLHLKKSGTTLTLPQPIPAHSGAYIIAFRSDSGKACHLRLMSFVEGEVYAQASQNTDIDQALLQASLGAALAQLNRGLADFTHSAMHRHVDWDISNLATLNSEIAQLNDVPFADMVRKHVHYFAENQANWKSSLPMQMIHNDSNDFNVIVTGGQVNALIDFGDMCYHLRVVDLAIAIVYALQTIKDVNEVCAVIARIVSAYHQHAALSRAELEVLYPLITARLCQSALMANRAYRQQPDNDYILVSQVGVRRLLTQLDQLGAAPFFSHLSQLAG